MIHPDRERSAQRVADVRLCSSSGISLIVPFFLSLGEVGVMALKKVNNARPPKVQEPDQPTSAFELPAVRGRLND